MTDVQPAAAPTPAGWYPDPSGNGLNRWWDGYNWSDATQAPADQAAAVQTPAGQAPVPSAMPTAQPYSYAPQELSSADPMTKFIWIIALWPLLGVINLIAYGLLGGYTFEALTSEGSGPADIADTVLALLAYLGMVAIVFLDHRELKARGLQTFPWGWAFIPIVYVIGRTVVVYRQTRKGLAPVFIYVGAFLLIRIISFVIGLVIGLSAV